MIKTQLQDEMEGAPPPQDGFENGKILPKFDELSDA